MKKIKKLVRDPKKFLADSKLLKNIYPNRAGVSKNPSLGFIIIGSNTQQVNESVDSLNIANNAITAPSPFVRIDVSDNTNLTEEIHLAATKLNTRYVKILAQGELLHKNFLKQYLNFNFPSLSPELLLHGYTNDLSVTQLDPLIANIKNSTNKDEHGCKDYVFPSLSVMIFKTELLGEIQEFQSPDLVSSNITNALKVVKLCEMDSNIKFIANAFTSGSTGSRIEVELQEIAKSGELLEMLLSEIENYIFNEHISALQKKNIFCLVHNIILLLLKNKKADELISCENKKIIKNKITAIVNALGVDVLKSYSSNNFNHIHKIGYFKLLGLDAERDLCYVEDVNNDNSSLKFKIASHNESFPKLMLNGVETIPLSVKVKELTIFDLPFAYEIYFWLAYSSVSQELSIQNDYITGLIVSGKRLSKSPIDDIIKSYVRKNTQIELLTRKAKLLRAIANFPIVKKRFSDSWVFIDNDLRADDNAEHFYRYVSKNHPEVKSYFLLSKQSPDWVRLKAQGFNLISFGGLAHRLALLNAKYLLSSHANPAIVNYLPRKHYADIMEYKFVFLQHGITKDDQSEWLNSRKIDFLVTAAQHEFSDISGRGRYRYTSQETILTGFPRYDNLVKRDESKKQILIMPTWRKGLAGELVKKSSKRIKNPEFVNSLFCEMWGGFLRSDALRKSAEENGYSVMFLPHPNLTDYLEDLAIPDYIQVGSLTGCSIQETFKDADVLITDYSSVAFDVAYMKKPVIYFQFDSDTFFSEHSYSKGYYDYEELGFGPVVSDVEILNTELKNMLLNNCILTPFYGERISTFFPYDDHQNSLRLFNRLNNEAAKNYDHTTIIEYLGLHTNNIDLNSIEKLLRRFENHLVKCPQWLKERLADVLNDIIFIGLLDDNKVVLQKCDFIINSANLEKSTDIYPAERITDTQNMDELLQFIDSRLQKRKERNISDKTSSHCLDGYYNSLREFVSFYKEQDYSSALTVCDNQLVSKAYTTPRTVLLLRCIALIKNGDASVAVNLFPSLSLNLDEKDSILCELYKHYQPEDKQNFELGSLLPVKDNSTIAIETFLLLSKNLPANLLSIYNERNVMPDTILIHYIDRLFRDKNFPSISVFLNDEFNKSCYLTTDVNRAKYLFTVFVSNGIERFLTELINVTGNDNLVYSLETMFLNNEEMDLDVLFKIIESVITKDLYPFSCAQIYQYALFFFKKSRPGLAKKLTTISIMKKHEEFYIDGRNWKGDDDYRTLLTAVAELNGAMEGLNKIG